MKLQASPITWKDQVVVDGNYFVYAQKPTERFYIVGIAFPVAPHEEGKKDLNMKGWIAVLEQLRERSPVINTIRLYQIFPDHDYSEFLQAAADLGFYVIAPLTSASGHGVLSREKPAPKCYTRQLYDYGKSVIRHFGRFPNVLLYTLGNEVMNSLESWKAAPCILAYARDLKLDFPNATLMYTMQHDGIGAAVSPSEAARLTMEYMSECPEASIDALGINIESWCSSTQTFDLNPDGSLGTYKDLYQHLNESKIALLFSELGCSRTLFNRDNGLERFNRDWKQVHTILGPDMIDLWSGFVAYAYDGPEDFRMSIGAPWDGKNVMEQLHDLHPSVKHAPLVAPKLLSGNATEPFECDASNARAALNESCKIDLLSLERMPNFSQSEQAGYLFIFQCIILVCLFYIIKFIISMESVKKLWKKCWKIKKQEYDMVPPSEIDCDDCDVGLGNKTTKDYQTF